MNYKDLQNIAFLSQEILTESATQEHNALDRWPYTSPYLQESTEVSEERKDPPVSRMSKQARRKAFRLGNEINDPESGIGLNVKDDPTAKQLRNMARVGGKQVKSHIKKGYEQGRLYDPQNAELNWKRNSKPKNEEYDLYDVILSHLIDEGYADTQEAAEAIMVNMSEDWRESIFEEKKPLPVSRMAKQARRIAFSYGTDVNSDEGSSGNVPHSNYKKALTKMARIGGKTVKQHIKKGYEQGSQYDPYYQELNSRNSSRNKYN